MNNETHSIQSENTYANTGPNSLHNPVTSNIPSQPPPPPPKTKGSKPVTMSSSDTDTDAGASASAPHEVIGGQATQQYSHSSLPRPTSRPLIASHTPHYQSQSLPRRSVNQSSISNVRSFVKSPATIATPFDEEYLCQLPIEDLVARIKILEGKNRKLVLDNGTMMKNLNQHIATMQTLKYQNFRLASDNNELRDLTVYLDDERNRARSLAKQWQDFGNHMSRVMKHEIANYARKLHVLEDKQFELVRENFELRQLCVLMDKAMNARAGAANVGNNNNDNNSRGSNASSQDNPSSSSSSSENVINTRARDQVRISQEILEYIKGLEERIHHLEWEKKQHQTIPMNTCQDDVNSNSHSDSLDQGIGGSTTYEGRTNVLASPPATLLEAMRNLRLSSTSTPSTLKDQGNSGNNTIVTTTPSSVNSSLRSRSVSPRKSSTRI